MATTPASQAERILSLEAISWCGPQLHIDITFDGIKFLSTFWYEFNLEELHAHYGDEAIEKIYFHIAMFTLLKLTSLKPTVVRISDRLSKYYTVEYQELWKTCFDNALGQWRYQHGMANWKGPRFACEPVAATAPLPVKTKPPQLSKDGIPVDTIAYCGGGKDGLLSVKLLETANVPFSSMSYTMSHYGSARGQHRLTQRVLKHCKAAHNHWVMITDPFLDIPLDDDQVMRDLDVSSRSDVAFTELFSVLPIMLQYGYRYVAIGNEYSANQGNLVWEEEAGKAINHQWGKSFEAEQLFTKFINKCLADIHYYSILQPISDVVIFTLLRQHLDCVPFTFSCNVSPPWCKRCPKCCYVWLSFQAYMPQHVIDPMFDNANLLDDEENQQYFKQMLGLGDQKPFECVGEIGEVRIAFEMCRRKGLRGKAMDLFTNEFGPGLDIGTLLKEYALVRKEKHAIPDEVAKCVIPIMENGASAIQSD